MRTGSTGPRRLSLVLTSGFVAVCSTAVIHPMPTAAAGAPTCDGVEATIVAEPGAGRIRGTEGPDVIVGSEQGQVIEALGGDDLVCARGGDDTVRGGSGDDVLWGGTDDERSRFGDLLAPGSGADEVHGGPAPGDPGGVVRDVDDLELRSDEGLRVVVRADRSGSATGAETDVFDDINDVTILGGGADVVRVLSSTAFVATGGGDDRIDASGVPAIVLSGGGHDVVRGGGRVALAPGDDRSVGASIAARGGGGEDVLVGRDGANDRLGGGRGADVLRGLGGNDRIQGDNGPDLLDGGPGFDDLDGERGLDRCRAGERVTSCRT